MTIDTHVHIGRFFDKVFTPKKISTLMKKCGVSFYLVSSTTTCCANWKLVLNEFTNLKRIDQKAIPCLWLTETFLEKRILNSLISSDIKWRCLKIHPALNYQEWETRGQKISQVFKLASELKIPILIHTGYDDYCSAKKYEEEIRLYNDVKVILAHGRPIQETIYILESYSNTYVDTAFMPIEDIVTLVNRKLYDKILWGTDTPIPTIYNPEIDYVRAYTEKLFLLQTKIGQNAFRLITHHNALELLNIGQ